MFGGVVEFWPQEVHPKVSSWVGLDTKLFLLFFLIEQQLLSNHGAKP
jgi:hypothetical protein